MKHESKPFGEEKSISPQGSVTRGLPPATSCVDTLNPLYNPRVGTSSAVKGRLKNVPDPFRVQTCGHRNFALQS
ncbi:hypothetical protein SLEP1_g59138 [Rubroshorea leprosula]|uniref:Uncharacterized protein n=1 Tax=Rubroshorea leprosula TaxID=152421 RepID=A0AAV5MRH3_9ROSI|nr:hypothetical protein SLEP1_g59138 [Rubroshorea leprosula]